MHINQELLFCETCDTVFCTLCTGGSHNDSTNSCEHTIIPFSIAIKRMSEILLYKANECISKVCTRPAHSSFGGIGAQFAVLPDAIEISEKGYDRKLGKILLFCNGSQSSCSHFYFFYHLSLSVWVSSR